MACICPTVYCTQDENRAACRWAVCQCSWCRAILPTTTAGLPRASYLAWSFQMPAEGFLSCPDSHVFNSPFRTGTLNQYSITYDFQFLISMCLNWVAERHFVLWGIITRSIILGFLKDIYLIIYYGPGSHCVRPPGTQEGTCLSTSERDQNCPRML